MPTEENPHDELAPRERGRSLPLDSSAHRGRVYGEGDVPVSDGGTEVRPLSADVERAMPDAAAAVDRLAADNTSFATALHRAIVERESGANLFASPYSVSVALAMTYAGARGTTAERMRDALRFSVSDDDLHPAFNALTRRVEREPDASGREGEREGGGGGEGEGDPFRLRVVNALWGQRGFPFAEEYLDTLATHYGAGLNVVDFDSAPDAAVGAINEWVADRTAGRIEDLVGPDAAGPGTRLVLTNAIYFVAAWADPFEESDTEDRPFTALDGSTSRVPTMHRTDAMPYAERDGHQVVELPYVGGTKSMVVVLPAEGEFEAFERSLDGEGLSELLGSLERSEGRLALPRFTYRSSFSLTGALSDLGMERAFSGEADFSGMVEEGTDADLSIRDVVHGAYVDVDEEGTEAAAATAVGMGIVSVDPGPGPQWEMVVDRPFLFLIRDRETDSVLFLGRVVDDEALETDEGGSGPSFSVGGP